MTPATDNPKTARDVSPLRARLLQTEARVWRRNVLSLAAWLIGAAGLAFAGYFVLDYLTHFPAPVRLLLTLAVVAVFAVWLPRRHRRFWQREQDVDKLARRVENEVAARRPGGFGSVLVSGLEFGTRPAIGGSAILKDRVIVASLSDSFDPLQIDLHDRALQQRGLRYFGAAAGVYLLWAVVSHATLGVFVQRALGMSTIYPTRTQIVVVDYPAIATEGESFTIDVTAAGELPGGGVLRVNFDGESSFDLPLIATESGDHFQAEIGGAAKSLNFRVRLGDAESTGHRVRVVRPPAAAEGEIQVTAPAYTGIAQRSRPLTNLNVPAGSTIAVRVLPDRPVATCELMLGERALPMTVTSDGGYALAGLEVREPMGFSIRLVDADGIENRDRITYRIGVVADSAPVIRLVRPESESYWAPVSKVRWEARMSDEYGLRAVRLRLQTAEQTDTGEDKVLTTIDRPVPLAAGQLDATVEGLLALADTGVQAGQLLLVTVQARDAGPADEGADDAEAEEALWHSSQTLRLYVVTAEELRDIIIAEEQLAYKQIGDVTDDVKHQIRMMEMQEQLNKEQP